MARKVTQEITIAATPDRVFDVIADYARYPEFVPGVKACRPGPRTDGVLDVELEVDLGVKRIRYRLKHVEVRPRSVTWSLVSGDLMKLSNGSWELQPVGEGTRALYTVEVQIAKPPLVPQVVLDRVSDELTRVQLPRTLAAFKARAEGGPGAAR